MPLDIRLVAPEARILISGPNAGEVRLPQDVGSAVLVQCGVPVPMADHSSVGIFDRLYIDIGDEQSIEDDLSTYSSHLRNMKHFVREAEHEARCSSTNLWRHGAHDRWGLLHKLPASLQ